MKAQKAISAEGGLAMDETQMRSGQRVVTVGNEALARRQRILQSDFEVIYEHYRRKVFFWCLRFARNPEDAEDLTQDAFLVLFRKIGTFRGESTFSTWLHSLVRNVALMRLRRKTLPQSSLEENLEEHEGAVNPYRELKRFERNMASSIVRIDLDRAIEQLPEGYKRVFFLHDRDDYSHEEIGGFTGWAVGTSKSQLHKARRRLRQLLEKAAKESPTTLSRLPSACRHKPGVGEECLGPSITA
jgi:RNA polymerase sigma-70 factor (ECF subfamily)